jgi:hypothetical protein
MKRLLLLILIVALLLLLVGCMDVQGIKLDVVNNVTQHTTGTYTIKIGGTVGLNFTGEYSVNFYVYDLDTDSFNYTTDSYSVGGQVPAEYTFEGMVAGGLFQKLTDDLTLLRVEIWKNGVLEDSDSTTDPWGAVMVVGGP